MPCVDPSSNARGRICNCFTESPAPILEVQVSSLLDKLVKRDSKLKLPVLEELCLHGCLTTDEAIEDWSSGYPSVTCHRRQPTALASCTFVEENHKSYVT